MDIFRQRDAMDCGPACLVMICSHYGCRFPIERVRELCHITRTGVSLLGISEAAETLGLRTQGISCSLDSLLEVELPIILHWQQRHFVVLYKIEKKRGKYLYHIADPALGKVKLTKEEFSVAWLTSIEDSTPLGVALLLSPTPEFQKQREDTIQDQKSLRRQGLSHFVFYLKRYRQEIGYVFLCLLVTSLLQLVFPFLTQSLVDVGIRNSDLNFITLVLIAQFILFLSQLSAGFVRSWLMLHVNYRVNILFISDYLAKLMRLPIRFFDSKNVGDILQRISDNSRIQNFLTGSSIGTLFSFVSFIIFAIVLGVYSLLILALFLLGNTLYIVWVISFMKYRREIDNRRFAQAAAEQSNLYQLVTGMQEIKLNNNEQEKRWEWERIQVKLYKIGIKGLALGQVQQVGTIFFSQTTNLLVTFIAARSVVNGEMTLGMMMALTYIIGQLSAPVEQFIGFAQSLQDARISIDRLNEINSKQDEITPDTPMRSDLPEDESIYVEQISFNYEGADRDYVLKGLSLTIPQNKVTAIVGASGSGKTTLLKLLLGFYPPQIGEIRIGNTPLAQINPHFWRAQCGAVMQEGYIFSDTIAHNIAMERNVDTSRLIDAIETANLKDYIDGLPLGVNTKIGMDGNGLSQGQRQRILIARAVYKRPRYIFLDEATNSLDANNEQQIMQHLKSFYNGRTVVIVAHRLSTVKDADNIIVLDQGEIVEQGTHTELIAQQSYYYMLVHNQLELGS